MKFTMSKNNVGKYIKTIDKRVNNVKLGVSEEMRSILIQITPKDTGVASSSWNISLNQPDTSVNKTPKHSAIYNVKSDDTVVISNSVPYIDQLNQGSSNQAPARFVESVYSRRQQLINKWVEKEVDNDL